MSLKNKAAPKRAGGFRVVNRGGGRGEIYVYGLIGGDWFGDGATATTFKDELRNLGNVTEIDLHIDSEGGSVKDAQAMYTLLVKHSARVTVHIDGWACSAASFLAMAGNEVLIGEGGMFMIHNAMMGCYGSAEDMDRAAALLRTTNETIGKKYADRTGQPMDHIREWMDAETWFTGTEAVEHGFCDKVVENLKIAARAAHDVSRFRNVPTAYKPRRAAAVAHLACVSRKP